MASALAGKQNKDKVLFDFVIFHAHDCILD